MSMCYIFFFFQAEDGIRDIGVTGVQTCALLLGRTDNPLFELALRLEEIALKDEYFVSRKLYPNVDFYSGMIYSAIGIPRSMFTVMFAIARTVGWVAHWQEDRKSTRLNSSHANIS